jgi:hypothetical protein
MTVAEATSAGKNAVLETKAGDIELNAAVTAGKDATVLAAGKIDQNADITATKGDAYVETKGGDVTMTDGTTTTAGNNARVTASENVKLSMVKAGNSASIKATAGSISDNTAAEDANITAKNLRLEAGKAIGGANDADIETSVDNIELLAKDGDAFVHNDKAVTVGGVKNVKVRKVKTEDADTTDVEDGDLTGAEAKTGNLSILADGKMTVDEAVSAAADGKNVVLETTAGDIVLNDSVTAGQDATVLAAAGVQQNANITATARDVWVQAQDGSVTMKDGTTTTAGNNAYVAASKNVNLSAVSATKGTVSVKATSGSITDNTAAEKANITSKNLRLEAGNAIGGKKDADIETSVGKIELEAKDGDAYVHNMKALEIGSVGDVKVQKVDAATAVSSAEDKNAGEDLVGVKSTAGSLSVFADGKMDVKETVSAKKDVRLVADGALKNTAKVESQKKAGNVLLKSKNGDVTVSKVVEGKNVTVSAGNAVNANAKITAKEDLYLKAGKGNITAKEKLDAKQTMGLSAANGKITTSDINAKNLATLDKNGLEIKGKQDTEAAFIVTGGDYTTTFKKDGELAVQAGGKVDITANNGTVKAINASASDARFQVTEVLDDPDGRTKNTLRGKENDGTEEVKIAGGKSSGKVEGINGNKGVDIKAKAATGTSVRSSGGNVTIDTTGDYSVNTTTAGGNINATVDGSVNAETIKANGDATLTVGNNATISTLEAKNLTVTKIGGNLESENITVSDTALLEEVDGDVIVKDSLSAGTLTATKIGGNMEAATVEVKGDATLERVEGNVTVTDFSSGTLTADIGGDVVSEKTFAVAGDADMTVGKNATFNELTAGQLTATVGGDVQATTIAVNGDANFESVGGDFTFDEFTAGNVLANVNGNVAMGHLNAGSVEIHAGSISDNGSLVEANTLTMTASGDIGSPSKDIAIKAKTINQISGNNVYLEDVSPQGSIVNLGLIEAKGDLNLTAANIGMANGGGGYIDANGGGLNLRSGRDMFLNIAGFMGTAGNQLEIFVGGKLTVDSGKLHGKSGVGSEGTEIWYQYMLLDGTEKNTDWWNGYRGQASIPGLVIYRNRILDGHPELWLRINRAQDFTVETPELKSRQGVFGAPLFIHTDMDVSEAASIGTVDNITIANTHMETLANADVYDKFDETDTNALDYLKRNSRNPSRQDKIYTKEFNSKK